MEPDDKGNEPKIEHPDYHSNKMNIHHIGDTNLLNLNGNLLCAIEINTTGSRPNYHDIFEICVLPLNAEYKKHKGILPFYCLMKPKRPQNIQFDELPKRSTRESIYNATLKGLDSHRAADIFNNWFEKIKFKIHKRLSILAYDWVSKRAFIIDWLGETAFNQYFDYKYRDPLAIALYCNDVKDMLTGTIPFPKVDIAYLASQLKVDVERGQDTMIRCVQLAEIYKRSLKVIY